MSQSGIIRRRGVFPSDLRILFLALVVLSSTFVLIGLVSSWSTAAIMLVCGLLVIGGFFVMTTLKPVKWEEKDQPSTDELFIDDENAQQEEFDLIKY